MPRLALILALLSAAPARAGIFAHRGCACGREHLDRPHPTPEPGARRCIPHTHERAGGPLGLRTHREPTEAAGYCGHYVGGGGGHGAGPRGREEGTWGWDYSGIHLPRRVFPGWNHGRRAQGGIGAYATEPPVEVPNVFATDLHGHRGETRPNGH